MTFSLPMNYGPRLFFMGKTKTWLPWKFSLKLLSTVKSNTSLRICWLVKLKLYTCSNILTWLHFSMVYYSVNKAINDKKSVIAIQNSSGIHVLYLLSRLQSWRTKFHHWKWTTNFKGSILLSLDKFQWNKKSSFSRPIQMFILANSKWTAVQDKSFKWKLKLLCYNNKKM